MSRADGSNLSWKGFTVMKSKRTTLQLTARQESSRRVQPRSVSAPAVARRGGGSGRTSPPPLVRAQHQELKRQPHSPDLSTPPAALRLTPARAGDHSQIHQLLLSIFHGPSAAEFQAQLDEPLYEPTDRLIVNHDEQIIAHLRLNKRLLQCGGLQIPSASFLDLATAPEYRGRGLATALLAAGERQAAADGAQLFVTRTRAPALFARQGWSIWGRHCFSGAATRRVLAQLQDAEAQLPAPAICANWRAVPGEAASASPLHVRPFRRIELPAICRLYSESLQPEFGATVRTELHWEWLMARGAWDRAFVAVEGGPWELPELLAAVRGYVFVKEGRIVELAADRSDVQRALLKRVCGEAIERNLTEVSIEAPRGSELHQICLAAGGEFQFSEEHLGEVFMAKALDPVGLLSALAGPLHQRILAADLPYPFTIGLEIFSHGFPRRRLVDADSHSYQLNITRKDVKLQPGRAGKHALSIRRSHLTPLALGHWSAAAALASGRLRTSSRTAEQYAQAMFPAIAAWRPPLDDLVA